MAARIPPFLLRLRVQNFRSLRHVDLTLQPLNVLVGPNGAGKSNLLDVITFLGDSVREDLAPALAKRGGYDRVRFRGVDSNGREWVEIEIEAAVTKYGTRTAADRYTLRFKAVRLTRRSQPGGDLLLVPDRRGLRREESFMFKRTEGRGRRINITGRDLSIITDSEPTRNRILQEGSLGLSTLPRLGPEEGGGSEQVEALASLFASFRVFDVNVDAIRKSRDELMSPRLYNDASNLASYMQHLKEFDPERFALLEEDARLFIPGLEELEVGSIGGASTASVVRLREHGLKNLTELAEASYGSIRAIALLALLYDPRPPKLTCVEEIDHGLHPYVLDRLVELLRQASRRTQLLIATHSPALVNRLEPSELIVCERDEDAGSRIPAISSDYVRKMEYAADGELGLGELWFTGALGGVPNL
ncbi:MAG: AAA family ATPase [Pseudonocardia sp.]